MESAAAAPVFRLQSSNRTIFFSAAGSGGGDGLNSAQRGTTRERRGEALQIFSTVRSK